MRKIVLLAHLSLDGYLASATGSLEGFPAGVENLAFICNLTRNADAALFGRKSFELLNAHWPTAHERPGANEYEIEYARWYNTSDKVVVSSTIPAEPGTNTRVLKTDIAGSIQLLKALPGKDILLFGSGQLSRLLMQHRLIDSFWIFFNPITFGNGVPLFCPTPQQLSLKLQETKLFANGEAGLHYILGD